MLNILWFSFFVVAAVAALGRWLIGGDESVFAAMVSALFEMARVAVEVMVLLFGTLTLWLGFLKIAEEAGLVRALARGLAPLFTRLMPGVPRGHPSLGLVTMNFAANALGLDNAATPIGLKAMHSLQTLNPEPDRATDAQILFLVLNASSLTLLPVSIFVYRMQQGAADPALVFAPILLATMASTLAGLVSVAIVQKIRLADPVLLAAAAMVAALGAAAIAATVTLGSAQLSRFSSLAGNLLLFGVVVGFLVAGAWRRVPLFDRFIDGARDGFAVARDLLPYLVAMLAAIGVLRASGALDIVLDGIRFAVAWLGLDTRFVDALPTALVKPFSGSAARAMLIETMQNHGVDSFAALCAAAIQGSTETTFYVLAVYFGAVQIRRTRHAVGCALIAEGAGIIAAIAVCYAFFGDRL